MVRVGREHFCVKKAAGKKIRLAYRPSLQLSWGVRGSRWGAGFVKRHSMCAHALCREWFLRREQDLGSDEGCVHGRRLPPIVGSLFSWKSSLTKRRTSDDYESSQMVIIHNCVTSQMEEYTFPTAASPSSTSLTLLLGFGAFALADSAISETAKSN